MSQTENMNIPKRVIDSGDTTVGNLERRIRARNVYAFVAVFFVTGLLGFGAGSLVNEWYDSAAALLALSAATFIFATTKGDKIIESRLDKRYPLGGSL